MRIKGFKQFDEEVYESYRPGYMDYGQPEGKTMFSKWLRGVSQRMKGEIEQIRSERPSFYGGDKLGTADIHAQSRAAREIIPGLVRLLTGAGAAIADFFTPSGGGKKIPKTEIKKSQKKVLDDWEDKELGSKKVTDQDAESFYRSGVLKGQKYFGSGYDPMQPRNKNEETFSDYLNSAMHRYYDRIHTKK